MNSLLKKIKKKLYNILFYFQVHKLFYYLNKNKITILMYHGFSNNPSDINIRFGGGKHIDIGAFESQIEYLKDKYNIIPLDSVVKYYREGTQLPSHPLVLTFDDGYKSNYLLAYKILKKHHVPATIFLTTSFVNNKKFLWTDKVEYSISMAAPRTYSVNIGKEALFLDLRDDYLKKKTIKMIKSKLKSINQSLRESFIVNIESCLKQKLSLSNPLSIYTPLDWKDTSKMIKSKLVSFGGHTHTHAILTKCDSKKIDEELGVSKKIIEKKLKIKCDLFCYPNGSAKDFNTNTKQHLIKQKYLCGLTTISGLNDDKSNVYKLKRIGVNGDNLIEFKLSVSGVTTMVKKLLRII